MTAAPSSRHPVAAAYPPQPWDLQGQMTVLLWRVPAEVVEPRLARGVALVQHRGVTLIATAWVDYGPGSVLRYHELLVAAPVLQGRRPGVCVIDIWVDSQASLAGGRALWGIPKELATFGAFDGHTFAMTLEGRDRPVAEATWTPGRRLPGRWATRYGSVPSMGDTLDGDLRRSRVRSTAALELGTASMSVDPDGPLAYLSGRTPVRVVRLRDFALLFGG